jgi:hypothetical protein
MVFIRRVTPSHVEGWPFFRPPVALISMLLLVYSMTAWIIYNGRSTTIATTSVASILGGWGSWPPRFWSRGGCGFRSFTQWRGGTGTQDPLSFQTRLTPLDDIMELCIRNETETRTAHCKKVAYHPDLGQRWTWLEVFVLETPLTFLTQNSVFQTRESKSDFQTRNSGFLTRNSGFRTRNSGFRTRYSGFRTRDSGFRTRNSGFRTRNSGFRTRDSVFRTRNSILYKVEHSEFSYLSGRLDEYW